MAQLSDKGLYVESLRAVDPRAHSIALTDGDGLQITMSADVAMSIVSGMSVIYNQALGRPSGDGSATIDELLRYFAQPILP